MLDLKMNKLVTLQCDNQETIVEWLNIILFLHFYE
jgi:hypothetical protein